MTVYEVRLRADGRLWMCVMYREMAEAIAQRCESDPAAGPAYVVERFAVQWA